MKNFIQHELEKTLPPTLVAELLEAYADLKKNFYLGNCRANEVDGGRFTEAAFRILEFITTKTFTILGKPIDTEKISAVLISLPFGSYPESVRIHIPRTLRVIYDIRNKRDAAHLGDGIDPNLQDSTIVSAASEWVLAEFVRISGGILPDAAYKLVKGIMIRRVPAVEDFDGFLKTLRPSLGPSDRLLLLLYHSGDNGAAESDLGNWLKPAQRPNLARTLTGLEHEKDVIVRVGGKYKITRRGIHEIERRNLIEIE